jgi:hypothetical protein
LDEVKYNTTVAILKDVYVGITGRVNGNTIYDGAVDKGHVQSVTMGPRTAQIGVVNSATQAIWDHINTYNEPVVVVVDSNKQLANGTVVSSSFIPNIQNSPNHPTLHYLVIRGIQEDSAGGTRRFSVYDPANRARRPLLYTEEDLRTVMDLPWNTWPKWVYDYPQMQGYHYPAYILKVQGK